MKGQLRIDQMYAFTMVDADDTEGVVAFLGPDGMWMPLVGADLDRVASLRPIAQGMARRQGRPITLCKFSQREVVETIQP